MSKQYENVHFSFRIKILLPFPFPPKKQCLFVTSYSKSQRVALYSVTYVKQRHFFLPEKTDLRLHVWLTPACVTASTHISSITGATCFQNSFNFLVTWFHADLKIWFAHKIFKGSTTSLHNFTEDSYDNFFRTHCFNIEMAQPFASLESNVIEMSDTVVSSKVNNLPPSLRRLSN